MRSIALKLPDELLDESARLADRLDLRVPNTSGRQSGA